MSADSVVIVGLARTPMGAFQGAFSTVTASQLGAAAIDLDLAALKHPVDVSPAVPREALVDADTCAQSLRWVHPRPLLQHHHCG